MISKHSIPDELMEKEMLLEKIKELVTISMLHGILDTRQMKITERTIPKVNWEIVNIYMHVKVYYFL